MIDIVARGEALGFLISRISEELATSCEFGNDCLERTKWFIEGFSYCAPHAEEMILGEEERIAQVKERPDGVDLEDLELLEMVEDELRRVIRNVKEVGACRFVMRELSLPVEKFSSWDIASWLLWEMSVITLTGRSYTLSVARIQTGEGS